MSSELDTLTDTFEKQCQIHFTTFASLSSQITEMRRRAKQLSDSDSDSDSDNDNDDKGK